MNADTVTESMLAVIARRYAIAQGAAENERHALRAAVRDAVRQGMSEVRAAKLAGVSRPTVRAWLGK